MQSRIHETVERPSVCPFHRSTARRVCCQAPRGQEISIDSSYAPALSSRAARRAARRSAGNAAALLLHIDSWHKRLNTKRLKFAYRRIQPIIFGGASKASCFGSGARPKRPKAGDEFLGRGQPASQPPPHGLGSLGTAVSFRGGVRPAELRSLKGFLAFQKRQTASPGTR